MDRVPPTTNRWPNEGVATPAFELLQAEGAAGSPAPGVGGVAVATAGGQAHGTGRGRGGRGWACGAHRLPQCRRCHHLDMRLKRLYRRWASPAIGVASPGGRRRTGASSTDRGTYPHTQRSSYTPALSLAPAGGTQV